MYESCAPQFMYPCHPWTLGGWVMIPTTNLRSAPQFPARDWVCYASEFHYDHVFGFDHLLIGHNRCQLLLL